MAAINTLIGSATKVAVRNQIAAILLTESAGQQAIAIAESVDPRRYGLTVYSERTAPWADLAKVPDDPADAPRLINVSWDSMSYAENASDIGRQKGTSLYHIDCFGLGISRSVGEGHIAGDEEARLEAEWNLGLVRGILMSDLYTYLALEGVVWSRFPSEERALDLDEQVAAGYNVAVCRMSLQVDFSEYSPEYVAETLSIVAIDVHRQSDGLMYLGAQYGE